MSDRLPEGASGGSGGDPSTTGNASGGAGGAGGVSVEACEEQCGVQHPDGNADYTLLRECLLCGACANACQMVSTKVCVNGVTEVATCSADAGGDCDACVAGACALEQLPDTNFAGVCMMYGAACTANVECLALNNCVSDCVAATATAAASTTTGGGMMGVGGN